MIPTAEMIEEAGKGILYLRRAADADFTPREIKHLAPWFESFSYQLSVAPSQPPSATGPKLRASLQQIRLIISGAERTPDLHARLVAGYKWADLRLMEAVLEQLDEFVTEVEN